MANIIEVVITICGIVVATSIAALINPIYGLILFVVVISLAIIYSQWKKPKIKIIFPESGNKIKWGTVFKGSYKNLNGKNIFLIHLPLKKDGDDINLTLPFYNQNIPTKNNGLWECSATIGLEYEDINREFEVYAIITKKTPPIKEELPGLPEHDACYKITVKRS